MSATGRAATHGSCGPSVIDYDNHGLLDLFVAGYGENFLYRNEGGGKFMNVAGAWRGRWRSGYPFQLGRLR
jgi:hypothetical protein